MWIESLHASNETEPSLPGSFYAGKIYILGTGAVGLPLAAFLTKEGKDVIAVQTRKNSEIHSPLDVTVSSGTESPLEIPVKTTSFSQLTSMDGIVVVTVKAHANKDVAAMLVQKGFSGNIVILQNGLGVERPFIEAQLKNIYRCVLYMTSQPTSRTHLTFRMIASSPIGAVHAMQGDLQNCVQALTSPQFQFHGEEHIQKEIWKKAIINAVFNSVCPLLDTDNGIFIRDRHMTRLAEEIVSECVALAQRKDVDLSDHEVMQQLMRISRGSDGVLISTLQDIRKGRKTEIEFLNLELARIAAATHPPTSLLRTELLGRMILARSRSATPELFHDCHQFPNYPDADLRQRQIPKTTPYQKGNDRNEPPPLLD